MAASVEGPVLSLINKRLRALKKKLNRISQMEESLSQGKTLNKEQEEVFKSKGAVVGAIDELEKLKVPLGVAVEEEMRMSEPKGKILNKEQEEVFKSKASVVGAIDGLEKLKGPLGVAVEEEIRMVETPKVKEDQNSSVQDLLNLLYFSSMFDVRSQDDFSSLMLTKNHERESCLSYDYVTEEDTDMLSREDLDLISQLGGLLVSRPVNSSLSHKNALELCVEHAKQWLAKSDKPISSEANITYAGLKAKLDKIMALNYFTIAPKMKATVEMAAAAGNYDSFQESQEESIVIPTECSDEQTQEEDAANFQGDETSENLSSPAEEPQKGEYGSETSTEVASHKELDEPPKQDQNHKVVDRKEQQSVPRRNYQNQRGGGYTGGNGRRGYSNGRGGRGGRGASYQNGGYYDQPGSYYQRSYQNKERVGGRGGGNNYQNYVPKAQAGHVPAES